MGKTLETCMNKGFYPPQAPGDALGLPGDKWYIHS
jgi:hypothetical protein